MQKARQTGEGGLEVREANHRMMNMLATLHSMFRREFSQFGDQPIRIAARQFENRIMAVSELLRTISTTSTGMDGAVDVYLERLSHALSCAILGPANIGCEIYSDEGRLPIHTLERLGFILIELALNASKYAFTDRSDGIVRVEMTRSGRYWRCTVADNGVGMERAGRGTGLGIIDALVRSLNGRLIIRSTPSGTCAHVVLPDSSRPHAELSSVIGSKTRAQFGSASA
jgi:two-component sensor histidine kinase